MEPELRTVATRVLANTSWLSDSSERRVFQEKILQIAQHGDLTAFLNNQRQFTEAFAPRSYSAYWKAEAMDWAREVATWLGQSSAAKAGEWAKRESKAAAVADNFLEKRPAFKWGGQFD